LATGRIFTLASPSANAWTLDACDSTNLQAVGNLPVTSVPGTPLSLIRWGSKGLAFSPSQNQLCLLRTPLAPTVLPVMAGGSRQDPRPPFADH
jgi:hypothetical protein